MEKSNSRRTTSGHCRLKKPKQRKSKELQEDIFVGFLFDFLHLFFVVGDSLVLLQPLSLFFLLSTVDVLLLLLS